MPQFPTDGGPLYVETDMSAFIAEPWNAISSLAIVLPAVYWAIRLKGRVRMYPFIYACIPLLLAGGIGSTFYHAFRTSSWMLVLDVLPALVLTASIAVYFWLKVLANWWKVTAIIVPGIGSRYLLYWFLPEQLATNLGYFISGTLLFLPILIYMAGHHFRHYRDILLSILFLCVSLVMRDLDEPMSAYLPMGSHFLWHLLSGVGAHFLALFLYKLRQDELNMVH